jgi:cytochrome P450
MSPRTSSTRVAPGPEGLPWVGNIFDVWKDPLRLFTRSVADHGDIVAMRFGPFRYWLLNDPEAIHHVLVDNNKNYTKSRNYQGLKLVLGEGLVTSEGDFWRRQRRLAQPAFHKEKLAGFARTMAEDTASMLGAWKARARTQADRPLDVHAEMMKLTLKIVARTLFSTTVGSEAEAIGAALAIALRHAEDYAESLLPVPPWVPTLSNLRFKRAVKTLDELVFRIIDERRKSGADPGDLLAMLMAATDDEASEGARGMTDRQLRDEVMTLVMAGHETTANALTWTFYLLANHPEVEAKLRQEVTAVLGDGDRTPTLADLPRLPYAAMVIQESMRLFPPVWAFERQAREADVVAGFDVPPKAIMAVCPYALHRNPAYWEDPERFDPSRFTPERVEARPRYAYLPFGGGPRQCIGNGFAMMEAQIILAMVVRQQHLALAPGFELELDPVVTLRPRRGMPMRLEDVPASRARA